MSLSEETDREGVVSPGSNPGTGGVLTTGGNNTLIGVGGVNSNDFPLVCVHVLNGHLSPITALSFSSELDLVFSGSQSGLLCLHTVKKGTFIRSITHMVGKSVNVVLVTEPGYLVAHSWKRKEIRVYWVNGQHRATVRVSTTYVPYSIRITLVLPCLIWCR